MKLGMQVHLGPGHIELDGDPAPPPQKEAQQPLLFGPCLWWLNGRPSQLLLSSGCTTVSFSRQTEGGTDVTHSEGGTIGIESLSVRETDSEGQSRDKDDDLLSRDETESRDPVSRDTALLEGVGARPKTTTKTLQRKNTPVVLPKVASLYGSLPVQYFT